MNIKEIIYAERWDHEPIEWYEHNNSLDRIEAAVQCILGVGDGSGNKFVYGDVESIKQLKGMFLQMESDKQRIAELEALLGKDESACTIPGDVCDYDGGCDTCPHSRDAVVGAVSKGGEA